MRSLQLPLGIHQSLALFVGALLLEIDFAKCHFKIHGGDDKRHENFSTRQRGPPDIEARAFVEMDTQPPTSQISNRMALALQLALESDTKLKTLFAARQQRTALMALALNDGSAAVGGGSGVASQCLELFQERRLLEE